MTSGGYSDAKDVTTMLSPRTSTKNNPIKGNKNIITASFIPPVIHVGLMPFLLKGIYYII